MAVPVSWSQKESPNVKILLFMMVSRTVRKNSVGNEVGMRF
jgi:hypothetical protein